MQHARAASLAPPTLLMGPLMADARVNGRPCARTRAHTASTQAACWSMLARAVSTFEHAQMCMHPRPHLALVKCDQTHRMNAHKAQHAMREVLSVFYILERGEQLCRLANTTSCQSESALCLGLL